MLFRGLPESGIEISKAETGLTWPGQRAMAATIAGDET
jgi:hypothetical protein